MFSSNRTPASQPCGRCGVGTNRYLCRPVSMTSSLARPRGGRSAKSSMLTAAPTWLQIACACGATASHSFRAPHSSTSKWLQLIQRSAAGSISLATASRTSGNIRRIPVWKSSGSSSLIRK